MVAPAGTKLLTQPPGEKRFVDPLLTFLQLVLVTFTADDWTKTVLLQMRYHGFRVTKENNTCLNPILILISVKKRCESSLALSQRWLEGSHPTEEGESAEAVAFFVFDNNPKYKSAPVSIHL